MLKKLKIKFILNNMIMVTIVLFTIFSSMTLLTYLSEEAKIERTLTEALNVDFNSQQDPNENFAKDELSYSNLFVVFINRQGEIVFNNSSELDDNALNKAISVATDSERHRGIISSLDLSFMKKTSAFGTAISFVSRESLHQGMSEHITRSFIIGIVSLVLFLYISNRLAGIAFAPAEQAWEQQKQFLADASHDLKTPLTVILANNNIITSHKDQTIESQMQWIESTNEEAGRMSELVNKMLELAKSESTNQELSRSQVNVSELCEHAILQFEVLAFEKNILIESDIEKGIIAKTNKSALSKIFEILFDNAIKYSDENEKIIVNLFISSKYIVFTINNNGEYIKENELPHVFERFYRTSKEREVGGHGLGLSIAKKKCEQIGAKISVESDVENGTTFTVMMKNK